MAVLPPTRTLLREGTCHECGSTLLTLIKQTYKNPTYFCICGHRGPRKWTPVETPLRVMRTCGCRFANFLEWTPRKSHQRDLWYFFDSLPCPQGPPETKPQTTEDSVDDPGEGTSSGPRKSEPLVPPDSDYQPSLNGEPIQKRALDKDNPTDAFRIMDNVDTDMVDWVRERQAALPYIKALSAYWKCQNDKTRLAVFKAIGSGDLLTDCESVLYHLQAAQDMPDGDPLGMFSPTEAGIMLRHFKFYRDFLLERGAKRPPGKRQPDPFKSTDELMNWVKENSTTPITPKSGRSWISKLVRRAAASPAKIQVAVARYLAGVPTPSVIATPFVQLWNSLELLYQQNRPACSNLLAYLSTAATSLSDSTGHLFDMLKPSALTCVVNYHSEHGNYFTLIWSVLELYGIVGGTLGRADKFFKSALLGVWSAVEGILKRSISFFKSLFTSSGDPPEDETAAEGPTNPDTNPDIGIFEMVATRMRSSPALQLGAAIAFTVFYVCFGAALPTNFWQKLRNLTTGLTAAAALTKVVRWVYSNIKDAQEQKDFEIIVERCNLHLHMLSPRSQAPDVQTQEEILRSAEQLKTEVLEKLKKYGTSPRAGIVRFMLEKLSEAITSARTALGAVRPRREPLMLVFVGAPGAGKTRWCHHLARLLSPQQPAIINLFIDHWDGYNGNKVAIWDEFDTDSKADYVEGVIGLVNSNPYVLNCDLIANKGMVFNSSVILATSNNKTPLLPNHPRAQAFYRRILIVDVENRAYDDWVAQNPGKDPPAGIFSPDFHHLYFRVRSRGDWSGMGDHISGVKCNTPIGYTVGGFLTLVDKLVGGLPLPEGKSKGKTQRTEVEDVYHDALSTPLITFGSDPGVNPYGYAPDDPIGVSGSDDDPLVQRFFDVFHGTDEHARMSRILARQNLGCFRAHTSKSPVTAPRGAWIFETEKPDEVGHYWAELRRIHSGVCSIHIIWGICDREVVTARLKTAPGVNHLFFVKPGCTPFTNTIRVTIPSSGLDLGISGSRPSEFMNPNAFLGLVPHVPLDKLLFGLLATNFNFKFPTKVARAEEIVFTPSLKFLMRFYPYVTWMSLLRLIKKTSNFSKGLSITPQELVEMISELEFLETKSYVRLVTPWASLVLFMNKHVLISPIEVRTQATQDPEYNEYDFSPNSLAEFVLAVCSSVWDLVKARATWLFGFYSLFTLNRDSEGKGKNKRGRGAMRRAVARGGVALSDNEYEEWQELRNDWRKELTVNDYLDLVSEVEENRSSPENLSADAQRFSRWRELKAMRQAAGARQMDNYVRDRMRNTGVDPRKIYTKADLGFAKIGRGLRDYEPAQAEGPNRVGKSAKVEMTDPTGNFLGWACHLGSGNFVTASHLVRDHKPTEVYIEGAPLINMEFDGDLARLNGPRCARNAYTLGSGNPVYYSDEWVPLKSTTAGTFMCQQGAINGWSYVLPSGFTTKKGDCGTPLFDSKGGLVGLHVAASKNLPVKYAQSVGSARQDPTEIRSWKGLVVEKSSVSQPPLPTTTAYSLSPGFHPEEDLVQEMDQPGLLGSADLRNPVPLVSLVVQELKHFDTPGPQIPPSLLRRAIGYVRETLVALIGDHRSKPLSFGEALRTLNWDTSCGPHVPGLKKDYLQKPLADTGGTPLVNANTSFYRHLQKAWGRAMRGLPVEHCYKVSLKDELLPRKKIFEVPKRRLLWGADLALTTVAAAAFAPVFDRIKETSAWGPISVGISMESTDIIFLQEGFKGYQMVAVDYSRWDSTQNRAVISASLKLISEFVEDAEVVSSAVASLAAQPRAYCYDVVYTPEKGLPSGMPGTSIINSLNHLIYFTMAVLKAYDDKGLVYCGNPLAIEHIVTYGDDAIYGFTSGTLALLPQVVEALRSFGLHPTSPEKGEVEMSPSRIVYLKRELWNRAEGWHHPRLALSSILRQAIWFKGRKHSAPAAIPGKIRDAQARATQLGVALILLSAHGQEIYENWLPLFVRSSRAAGLELATTDYWTNHATFLRFMTSTGHHLALASYLGFDDDSLEPSLSDMGSDMNIVMEGPSPMEGAGSAPAPGVLDGTSGQVVLAQTSQPPSGAAQLAVSASGQPPGPLPPHFYGNFVLAARASWSPNQPPGTFITSMSLNPRVNPYLRVYSQLWNGWAGDMWMSIMISGAGSLGGRLIAAALPPGINPRNVHDPTGYPHAFLEPNAPPTTLLLSDINSATYHNMSDAEGETSTAGIWVHAPLVNPFQTGGNGGAIDVSIFTAPANNFVFMIPRSPTEAAGRDYGRLLPSDTRDWRSNRFPTYITQVRGRTGTWDNVWNHFNSQGYTFGWGPGTPGNFSAEVNSGVILNVGQANTGSAASTNSWVATFHYRAADGIMPGIPPFFPDFACIEGRVDQSNSGPGNHPGALGAGFMINGSNSGRPSIDLTESRSVRVLFLNGDIANPTTAGHSDRITGLSMHRILRPWSGNTPGTAAAQIYLPGLDWSSTDWAMISPVCAYNTASAVGVWGSGRDPPDDGVTVQNAPQRLPPSGYCHLIFDGPIPYSYPGVGRIGCSQPEQLSSALASHRYPIPAGSMAVFSLTGGGGAWTLGIMSDGSVITEAFQDVIDVLTTPYEVNYVGLYNLSYPLQAPRGIGNGLARSSSRWQH
uniref:Genome polyprotein n=1 Tax=Shelduck calicivirus TaxID=2212776 RepID=A0A3G1RPL4_9CALI|nr:MAG: polyprotein [Shelduck calicivirus]